MNAPKTSNPDALNTPADVLNDAHSQKSQLNRSAPPPVAESAPPTSSKAQASSGETFSLKGSWFQWVSLLGAVALLACLFLWQKLSGIQEILARQTFDATTMAQEAKGLAKEAAELSRDSAAHLSLLQTQLSELSLQRTQLESLMQTLSRTRDENLLDELESSIRLAQQQAQLTGSVAPLLSALKLAQAKLAKLAQPRMATLERALSKDIERIKSFAVADTPSVLFALDELVRLVDDLPLANEMGQKRALASASTAQASVQSELTSSPETGSLSKAGNWVHDVSTSLASELWRPLWLGLQGLVRISRIDEPQAVLLSPEQGYFVRENLKLHLLNAKLELLARQPQALGDDVSSVQKGLNQYFDTHAKSTQSALAQLGVLQKDIKQLDMPHLDDTLAAFASVQVGR
jgi:uroporphyrin-III C-methyltransferase